MGSIEAIKPMKIEVKNTEQKNESSTEQESDMKNIQAIGDMLVESKIISKQEANKQVSAIGNFFEGKMSYAEMRAIAG